MGNCSVRGVLDLLEVCLVVKVARDVRQEVQLASIGTVLRQGVQRKCTVLPGQWLRGKDGICAGGCGRLRGRVSHAL